MLADVKLDGGWAPRPELELPDFVLRDEVITLINHLDRLVNTTIEHLEVQAGTPTTGTIHSFPGLAFQISFGFRFGVPDQRRKAATGPLSQKGPPISSPVDPLTKGLPVNLDTESDRRGAAR